MARAGGPIVLLLVVGVLFAAGSRKLTVAYSPDVALYGRYTHAALGFPLFHSLPREYPALALGVFLPPLAIPLSYALSFSLLAAAGGIALVLSSDGLPEYPGWSRRTCYYLLLGSVAIVFARYDVFPALAAVLAVEGARRGNWRSAWAWAVLGGLLKLFPLLLLPGFFLVERAETGHWPLRRLWIAFVPTALVTVGQLATAPKSVLSSLDYQFHRGFELSSLQGTIAFIVDPLHAHWVSGFGSVEVVGPGHLAVGLAVTLAAGLTMLTIWVLAGRGRLSVVAVSLTALSIAVLAEKSFAPQYLVWLAPFWAYWPMRRGWVTAAILTTIVFPLLYGEAHVWGPGFYFPTILAMVRNVILLVATINWLFEQLRLRRQTPEMAEEMQTPKASRPVRATAAAG